MCSVNYHLMVILIWFLTVNDLTLVKLLSLFGLQISQLPVILKIPDSLDELTKIDSLYNFLLILENPD